MATSSTFTAADGAGYESQMGRWSRRLAPLFIEFCGVASGNRVLDVGCGTGNLAFALAENPRVRSVDAIDFSPEYIDYARQRARGSRPSFQVGDACALPFPDGSFDHSLSMLVIQFIPEPERAVREMTRVTRAGGTVAAVTWNTREFDMHRVFFGTAGKLDAKARDIRAASSARPMARSEGLLAAWHNAGLQDVALERLTISMDFASFADFWAPFEGQDGPYAQYYLSLEAEHKAKLRGMVQAVYLDGKLDGPRSLMAPAWAVKGTVP